MNSHIHLLEAVTELYQVWPDGLARKRLEELLSVVRDKIWWTQAEGLNALLLMHERFGSQTPRYWQAFGKQWQFIWRHQVDHVHGEWHGTVLDNGSPKPGPKGSVWKAAYHNGRALIKVSDRLRHMGR